LKKITKEALEFALFTLQIFRKVVLKNPNYMELITSEAYTHETYYMGLVDADNKVNFYDGTIRVVSPDGSEFARFDVHEYLDHIEEHVEPWTFVKFPYLKKIGWHGFIDGKNSGIMAVAPLARLNVADGMATPRAQEAYEEFFETLGKPCHFTLATHWARVVEMIYAAERMNELINDRDILGEHVRNLPESIPQTGMGVVEAPRGTLIHHYETDEKGIIKKANLLVATQHNAARIALSVDKAAKSLIKNGKVTDGILNMIEMAFRAYDPCHACATHSLPGKMPIILEIRNKNGEIIEKHVYN
jgi:F420-non-reducing hydrogenase large subunit